MADIDYDRLASEMSNFNNALTQAFTDVKQTPEKPSRYKTYI